MTDMKAKISMRICMLICGSLREASPSCSEKAESNMCLQNKNATEAEREFLEEAPNDDSVAAKEWC